MAVAYKVTASVEGAIPLAKGKGDEMVRFVDPHKQKEAGSFPLKLVGGSVISEDAIHDWPEFVRTDLIETRKILVPVEKAADMVPTSSDVEVVGGTLGPDSSETLVAVDGGVTQGLDDGMGGVANDVSIEQVVDTSNSDGF